MGFQVENKTALVTGANRGIGRTITESLLAAGAKKVYAAVRDVDTASALVEKYGERVVPLQLDMTRPETIAAAAEAATDVQLVVNNAGVFRGAPPLDSQAFEALEFEFDVNVYGLLRVAQSFAPVLRANGGGAFVQLNSVASLRSFAEFATYAASKSASYSLTQGLRDQFAEQGTLVVSVHPGPIDTAMARQAGLEDRADPPEVVAEAILNGLAAGTFHVFPDSYAKELGAEYQGFAEAVIEANKVAAS